MICEKMIIRYAKTHSLRETAELFDLSPGAVFHILAAHSNESVLLV
jgi:hypothetical protein